MISLKSEDSTWGSEGSEYPSAMSLLSPPPSPFGMCNSKKKANSGDCFIIS